MSKQLKPYEKENLLIKKIRNKKAHQHRRKIEVKAIERGLERLIRTFAVEKEAYITELKAREVSIENVENQIKELTIELKSVFPKPKPKSVNAIPKNLEKVACEICGNEYAKSGIKGHRKACLKKQQLEELQSEIDKLEIDETPEVEEIEINLDELTEDVSFIKIEDPKEEGD